MKQNATRWQGFVDEARTLLSAHQLADHSPFDDLEIRLTTCARPGFPNNPIPAQKHLPGLRSPLKCGRPARQFEHRDRSVDSIFQGWYYLVKFCRLHKQIQKFNRQRRTWSCIIRSMTSFAVSESYAQSRGHKNPNV